MEKESQQNIIPKSSNSSVPFQENLKKNIDLSNNSHSFKNIAVNAIKFHSQGNISAASKYYKYLINKGLQDCRVFSNYGTILRDAGNLKEAELYLRKAIKLNSNYVNAHVNLGNILRDLGNLKEAES